MNHDASPPNVCRDDVYRLAMAVLSGEALQSEMRQLEHFVVNEPMARRWYVEFISDASNLRTQMGVMRENDAPPVMLPELQDAENGDLPKDATPILIFQASDERLHRLTDFSLQSMSFAYVVAAILVAFGLAIASVIPTVSAPNPAAQDIVSLLPNRSTIDQNSKIVGRVTAMADCVWEATEPTIVDSGLKSNRPTAVSTQHSLHASIALGERLSLRAGLMEITYDTGAKVILQGPVQYEVESKNGGFMSVGKLTGKVTTEAARGLTIRTPTAVITDLGTEFGVEVDNQGRITSHVFRGTIKVQTLTADGNAEGNSHVLHENESVRVEKNDGQQEKSRRVTVFATHVKPADFVREIPRNNPKLTVKAFDLVDAAAGGDGFSGRRGMGIDPMTGQTADKMPPWQPPPHEYMIGDWKYHRVNTLPFVDGVFIPDGSKGPVQIDSAGHLFPDCPTTMNASACYVWAGGPIPQLGPFPAVRTVLGNVDFASTGHGLLFLHANKGVTFNLDAVRRANSAYKITKFYAKAGSTAPEGTGLVDVWVLIDGRVRYRRWQINSNTGALSVVIPIAERDRFLTLAATDGGNGIATDWIIFGDPTLELTSAMVREDARSLSKER